VKIRKRKIAVRMTTVILIAVLTVIAAVVDIKMKLPKKG
jgi:hypothetical protein